MCFDFGQPCLVPMAGSGEVNLTSYILYLNAITYALGGVLVFFVCGLGDYAGELAILDLKSKRSSLSVWPLTDPFHSFASHFSTLYSPLLTSPLSTLPHSLQRQPGNVNNTSFYCSFMELCAYRLQVSGLLIS